MLDVLVTCFPHGPTISTFPQVRGYYLAEHLSRLGVRAAFRQLPLPGLECKVVICSGYQAELDWFDRHLAEPLTAIAAERLFCLTDYSMTEFHEHELKEYSEWFGARGGVLVHLPAKHLEPYEHWIGLGVDGDVVHPGAGRDRVLFDLPGSHNEDTSAHFDTRTIDAVRAVLPDARVCGSGPRDAAIRASFDEWIDYGQPHAVYAAAAFPGCFAFVPRGESLGLPVAEAQVAGACVLHTGYWVRDEMLVEGGGIRYERDNVASLVRGLVQARQRDGAAIRAAALELFDYAAVARRTLRAIGLTPVSG
jgi:hypothetical protein